MPRALATWISEAATSRTWRDVAGRALDLAAGDGLDRVDDERSGLTASIWPSTVAEVGLGGQEQRRGHRLDALGAHAAPAPPTPRR